jgi:hypothetical protein
VAELALDDDQRHAFARHLDGVGVAELVRREAPAHAGRGSGASELRAGGRGCSGSAACRAVDDAEQWADGEFVADRPGRGRPLNEDDRAELTGKVLEIAAQQAADTPRTALTSLAFMRLAPSATATNMVRSLRRRARRLTSSSWPPNTGCVTAQVEPDVLLPQRSRGFVDTAAFHATRHSRRRSTLGSLPLSPATGSAPPASTRVYGGWRVDLRAVPASPKWESQTSGEERGSQARQDTSKVACSICLEGPGLAPPSECCVTPVRSNVLQRTHEVRIVIGDDRPGLPVLSLALDSDRA